MVDEENLNKEEEIVETPVEETTTPVVAPEEEEVITPVVETEEEVTLAEDPTIEGTVEETAKDDYNAVETDPEEFFSTMTPEGNAEVPTVETVDEDSVSNNDENNTTEENENGVSTYPMDLSDWYLPEDDYVETDPDLMVKDWDDSKYASNPNIVRIGGPKKAAAAPLAAAAASITYRKLSGNNSIAASGITIDPESGKTLDAYIKGNALWINGTKVIWYED